MVLAGITYLDRVCISITAPYMMKEFGLDKAQMGWVFAIFQLAYGAFEIPSGHWGDKIGTRRVLTRIVVWWSTFTMVTAAAFNYASLLAIRFLFGIGEAGAWPNVARTFSRWFPLGERGRAQGIFFMGAHTAGGLTPLLVTVLLGYLQWRTVFLIFGSVGFFWALAWWTWFRDEPSEHSAVNPAELALIQQGRVPQARHELTWARWKELLSNASILGLCGMYLTQSYGFAMAITWFPTYLRTQRGFEGHAWFGILAGLPLIMSVPADLLGGIASDRASRLYGLRKGRAIVGGGSLFLAGLLFCGGVVVENPWLSAILFGLGGGMSTFLLGAAWSTCLDIGGAHAGVVSAAMNTAGQVGAFIAPILTGYVTEKLNNWSFPMFVTGALYCLGALCWFAIDPATRVWGDPHHDNHP